MLRSINNAEAGNAEVDNVEIENFEIGNAEICNAEVMQFLLFTNGYIVSDAHYAPRLVRNPH